ncbi:hypothetical protein B9Z55_018507 [Caenorhabditis nigoni]|uniref:Uncharacterized protein n=1 Tax=Caenorhabditis nigoni TaxID=1611254 RepID=A0A2G5TF22_9PELO|nr:hypothetical protein B9Z55_018507 [Caenorhabditis nigoni]
MDQAARIEMRKLRNEELKKKIAEQSLEHKLKMEMKKDKIELLEKINQQNMSDLLNLFLTTKEDLENGNTKNHLKNLLEIKYTSELIIEKIGTVSVHQEKQNEELLEVCHKFLAESLSRLNNQARTFNTDLLNSRYPKEPVHTQLMEYCKKLHNFLLDCPQIATFQERYNMVSFKLILFQSATYRGFYRNSGGSSQRL